MKNISLIFIITCLSFMAANSQTTYKQFIGGSLNTTASVAKFNSDNLQDLSNQKYGFGFYYGFKLKKFSIGFGMDFLNQTQGYTDLAITEISKGNVMFYPFVRYNFDNKLFVHSQFNFGASFISKKYDIEKSVLISDNEKQQQNYILTGATIGLGYSISAGERFLIEPMYKIVFSNHKSLDDLFNNYSSSDIMIDIAVIYKLK